MRLLRLLPPQAPPPTMTRSRAWGGARAHAPAVGVILNPGEATWFELVIQPCFSTCEPNAEVVLVADLWIVASASRVVKNTSLVKAIIRIKRRNKNFSGKGREGYAVCERLC